MNSKLLLCLVLVVFGFDAQRVRAFDEPYEVNRTNITTPYFSFLSVKAIRGHRTNNDEMVLFRIIVMSKDKHSPKHFHADLLVSDGKKYILVAQLRRIPGRAIPDYPAIPSGIPKSVKVKSVMFEFNISAKYLSHSQVELSEHFHVGFTNYLLKLRKFAKSDP